MIMLMLYFMLFIIMWGRFLDCVFRIVLERRRRRNVSIENENHKLKITLFRMEAAEVIPGLKRQTEIPLIPHNYRIEIVKSIKWTNSVRREKERECMNVHSTATARGASNLTNIHNYYWNDLIDYVIYSLPLAEAITGNGIDHPSLPLSALRFSLCLPEIAFRPPSIAANTTAWDWMEIISKIWMIILPPLAGAHRQCWWWWWC